MSLRGAGVGFRSIDEVKKVISTVSSSAASAKTLTWPPKHDVLGVLVSATDYEEAVETVAHAARDRLPAIVSLHAVHALVTASKDHQLRDAVNQFEIVAPDGQPVRWAMNWLHRTELKERVYGPELMLRLCDRAARDRIPVYLYGSSQNVIDTLGEELPRRFPGLVIAGAESPPYRKLTADEDADVVRRINASRAGIVFIGLGAPKQDVFAYEHRNRIQGVQVCVGAAFDFHAGELRMAPRWMQRMGLEWFYRLCREPRRLWQRYLVTNTVFVWKFMGAAILRRQPKKRAGEQQLRSQ